MKTYSFIKPDYSLQSNLMAFGFDCGSGWYSLIYELFDKIEELLNTKYKEFREDFEVVQVKEKWGELRVYISSGPHEIFDLIESYSDKSTHICENCGKPGTLAENKGWWSTLCSECRYEKTD